VPKRALYEQDNPKRSKIVSGLERSDKKKETDPLGRATGPF
jgi:hypothetical protein